MSRGSTDLLLSVSKLVRRGFTLKFDSDSCAIRSSASDAPIARAHVEDHPNILNTAPFIHHPRIRADRFCLNKSDEECHQLDPETIDRFYELRNDESDDDSASTPEWTRYKPEPKTIGRTFICLVLNRPIYGCIHHPTGRICEPRNSISDEDLTSTSERIHLKSDSYILQDPKIPASSFTLSVEAFHMPKEHLKTMFKDNPHDDYPPSNPSRRSTHTGERTHISSSQAALSLTSSRRSTRPLNTSICDDNNHLKMISHSCRSELHPHALPLDSVGDIDAYNHATITSLDSDLLRPSYSR
jgi:hypothetical protein